MNLPANIKWVHTLSGNKAHLALNGDPKTLCGATMANAGQEGDNCKRCVAKLAKVGAPVEETPAKTPDERFMDRVAYFEAKLAKVDNSHAKHSHRFTLSMDHSQKCPVFTDGVINALCECWHSDAKCEEQTAESLDYIAETTLPPLEIVKFNGKDYELTDWTADPYDPRNVDRDWVSLKAVDGSGAVMVQRFDLDKPEPVKAPQTVLTIEHTTSNQTPAPRVLTAPSSPSLALPSPRTPFTPADLDAMNLSRRIGNKCRLQGSTGVARIKSVTRRPGRLPSVVVEWSDGVTTHATTAEILLVG